MENPAKLKHSVPRTERPVKAKYLPGRGLIELFFKEDIKPYYHVDLERGTEASVKGALVWPQGLAPGYLIIAAQWLSTKVVWIYEEREFWAVSPATRIEDKLVLADFLAELWPRYYCKDYFMETRSEEDPNHRRYMLQMYKEPLIDPKPVLCKALYAGHEVAAGKLVSEYWAAKRVRYERGGGIWVQLQQISHKDIEELPAIRALRCLLSGIERTPWREPIIPATGARGSYI